MDELAQFRADSSDVSLATLKAAIDDWHDMVAAWSKAGAAGPTKQNLS